MTSPTCPRCGAALSNAECLRCALELGVREPTVAIGSSTPVRIGEYRVLGRLGEGGMGVVYDAQRKHPHRRVAIKLLRAAQTDAAHARFVNEYEVLAHLDHPSVASIIEAGVARVTWPSGAESESLFYAMELVDGAPITDACNARDLDERARIELMIAVAGAVQHAHQRGVIHRDIKPANIFLDVQGVPRVLDFGVARATNLDQMTIIDTVAGEVIGTVPYMSPEQLLGTPQAIDTRSDVFSLGVLLYELLTGKLPFEVGENSVRSIALRLERQDHIPPSVYSAYCRGDLDAIIGCCLQVEKNDRYESASALQDDLRRHLDGAVVRVRQANRAYVWKRQLRRYRRQFLQAALALAILIAFSAVSWNLYLSASRANEVANEQLYESHLSRAELAIASSEPTRQVRALAAIESAAALRSTPELATVAVAAMGVDGLQPELTIPDVGWSYPQPPADRFLLPVGRGNTVAIYDGLTGAMVTEIHGPAYPWRAVGADIDSGGKHAAITYVQEELGGWRLHVWDLVSMQRLFEVPSHSAAHKFHGRRLFTAHRGVQVWDVDSGSLEHSFAENRSIRDLSINPVRPWIAIVMLDRIEIWNYETRAVLHEVRPQLHQDLLKRGGELVTAFWDEHGSRLAIGTGTGHVHVWDVHEGVLLQTLSKHDSLVWAALFGPDPLLVSAAWDGTTRTWDLLTGLPAFGRFGLGSRPVAADRDRIALHQRGQINVYRYTPPIAARARYQSDSIHHIAVSLDETWMCLAGSTSLTLENLRTREHHVLHEGTAWEAVFAPDGSRLFAATRSGLYCWAMTEPFPLVWHRNDGAGLGVALSPDGDVLCAVLGGRLEGLTGHYVPLTDKLALFDPATGELRSDFEAVDGLIRPHFSPDGRYLAAGAWRGTSEVRDARTLEVLRSVPTKHLLSQFSPDGRFYVESETRQGERVLKTLSWEELSRGEPHAVVSMVHFGPSSDVMYVAGSGSDQILAKEMETCRVTASFPIRVTDASALCVMPSGDRIHVGTANGILITWDVDLVANRLRDLRLPLPLGVVGDILRPQARSMTNDQ